MMTRFATIFGGFGGRDRNSNLFEILILAIVMPLLAMVIQMAISRSREFLADEKAAKILHTGNGLASALEKLDYYSKRKQLKLGNESTSSLFIVNPFHRGAFVNLLSTHPPIKKRIKILKSF